MTLKIWLFGFIFLFILTPVVSAVDLTRPTPPPRPQPLTERPEAPRAPEPPQVSGDFEVPEVPGLRVRVFAHPPKPTPPPKPGTTPKPTPTPSPVPVENTSLVCGLLDPDTQNVVTPAGWHIIPGSITYRLNAASVPASVGGSNLDAIVQNGFSQYNQATGGKVSFSRGANTNVNRSRFDGQNVVTWGRLGAGSLGITYVWYYPSSGNLAEVDTVMNSRYKWSLSNQDACADNKTYDAKNIMTHELGHWMGLDDMYNVGTHGDATMYGYGSLGEIKKNTLTTGDQIGVSNIYSGL